MVFSSPYSFPLLSLPPEIIESIAIRLGFHAIKALRSSCKQLGDATSPLLFGTVRIRYRRRDLQSLQNIAHADHLRDFVHTLIYIGDKCCEFYTYGQWKAAVGLVDRSRPPSPEDPVEPPKWTLEHSYWRAYRRHQHVMKEQKVSRQYSFYTAF